MKYFKLGDTVCDMHYGLPTHSLYPVRVALETRSHIQIDLAGSSEFLQTLLTAKDICSNPCNKLAVVIDHKYDGWCVAAYSYDDRYFGMFEFRAAQKT